MPDPTLQQSTRLSMTCPPRTSGWFNSSVPIWGYCATSSDEARINPETAFAQLTALNPAYAQNLNRDAFVALIREGNTSKLRTDLQAAGVLNSHIDQFIGSSSSTSPTGVHQYRQEITIVNRHSNMHTGSCIGAGTGAAIAAGVFIAFALCSNPIGWGVLATAGVIVGAAVVGAAIGSFLGWCFSS